MESGKSEDPLAGLSRSSYSIDEGGGCDTGVVLGVAKVGLARPSGCSQNIWSRGALTVVQRYGVHEKEQQVLRKHTSERKVEKGFS